MKTGRRGFFGSLAAIAVARNVRFEAAKPAKHMVHPQEIVTTINLIMPPGGGAEAGRQVQRALRAMGRGGPA